VRAQSFPSRSRVALTLALAGLAAGSLVAVSTAPPARAEDRASALRSAAAYGPKNSYKIGIAVYDIKRHKVYGSGSYRSTFASESVVKAMIATRLILQGRMHGSTARRAYKMITQSDDGIASAFYGSVGGDHLINWVKRHYHVPDLGSPPHRAGWWGNTHITPIGLVKFYAKVKRDRKVGPWLLNAMHHAHKYGSDGTYQFFGLPSATRHAAVKQGWGIDYDDWGRSADFNTTGFVNGDRYAVAILARGPARTYGRAIGNALTQTARRLLPGGRFPDANPVIHAMSHRSGTTLGGQRINVRGTDFTGVRAFYFGSARATDVRVISAGELVLTAPAHAAGEVSVRVLTTHGISSSASKYRYVRPPTVTALAPTSGPAAGGTSVTLSGTDFTNVGSVWFGAKRATSFRVLSSTRVVAVAPAGVPGSVSVSVHTWYGNSPSAPGNQIAYTAPASGSAAPGTSTPPGTASPPTPTPAPARASDQPAGPAPSGAVTPG